jgi:cell wall-associated NlpC family hydrolase
VKRSRRGRPAKPGSSPHHPGFLPGRAWTRTAIVVAALTAAGLVLPSDLGSAAQQTSPPSLKSLIAQARKLQNQINTLSEQYDGLRIQLTQARQTERVAAVTATRDAAALGAGQAQVGHLAAESYMSGTVDPTLQFITSSDPQMVVQRAAIIQQLDRQKGAQVSALTAAENTARRARQTAGQQASVVTGLVKQMQAKTRAITAKMNKLNGAAFQRAMAVFNRTGSFPLVKIPGGNTLGERALRAALSQRGKPYVWGAAGPNAYDCSGLVMWAYAQVGVHLDHYTGLQWQEGEHISRSQLQPGDLIFFFSTISHVAMYIGDGLMVDAPSFGQDVMVQRIYWSAAVGYVHIVA